MSERCHFSDSTSAGYLRISLVEAIDLADEVIVKPQGRADNAEFETDVSFPTTTNEVYLRLAGDLELAADMHQVIEVDQAGDALFKDGAGTTHGIKLLIVQRRGLRQEDVEGRR